MGVLTNVPGCRIAEMEAQVLSYPLTVLNLTVRASKGFMSQRLVGHVVEVGPSVEQLPVRSWLSPQWPRWGRRAVIQVEGDVQWQAGERLYVQF